jgi:hypothetical protein
VLIVCRNKREKIAPKDNPDKPYKKKCVEELKQSDFVEMGLDTLVNFHSLTSKAI